MKRMMNKALLSTLFMLAVFVAFQNTVAMADDPASSDEVDGVLVTKNFNNKAEVEAFNIFNMEYNSTPLNAGANLTPFEAHRIALTVADPDTIADISSLRIVLYYTDIATPSEAAIGTDGKVFVVEWNAGDSVFSMVLSSGVASGDVTWEILSSVVPSGTDYEATAFTFEISFTISKVAPASDSGEWKVAAIINDGKESLDPDRSDQTVVNELVVGNNQSLSGSTFNMLGYFEIKTTTSQVQWENIEANQGFETAGHTKTISDITVIANATHLTQIRSSEFWDAIITEEIASRLAAELEEEGENKLQAIYESFSPHLTTLSGITFQAFNDAADDSGSAVRVVLPGSADLLTGASIVVSATPQTAQSFAIRVDDLSTSLIQSDDFIDFVGSNSTRGLTLEVGRTFNVDLQIALAESFQNAQYRGRLILKIVNE